MRWHGSGGRKSGRRSGHPVAQDGDAVLPADAFGDYRRRHSREVPQQLADLGLDCVDQRTPRLAVVVG